MSYLIDDVARILADKTPRRKALKGIGGLLLGGLFGTLGLRQASAQRDRDPGCRPDQQRCRGFNRFDYCIDGFQFCCGDNVCHDATHCCGTGGAATCCSDAQTCRDGRCSSSST